MKVTVTQLNKMKKDELLEVAKIQLNEIEDLEAQAVSMDEAYVDLERSIENNSKEFKLQILRAFENVMYRAECMHSCDEDTSEYLLENVRGILNELKEEYL